MMPRGPQPIVTVSILWVLIALAGCAETKWDVFEGIELDVPGESFKAPPKDWKVPHGLASITALRAGAIYDLGRQPKDGEDDEDKKADSPTQVPSSLRLVDFLACDAGTPRRSEAQGAAFPGRKGRQILAGLVRAR